VLTCASGESATTKLHLDFGISDVMPIGRRDEGVYLVKFVCGCTVFVGSGRVLWRTQSFTVVCEHIATA
jgi:hypothetical protein